VCASLPNLTAVLQALISLPLFFFLPGYATLAAFGAFRPETLPTESQESTEDVPDLCFLSLLLSVLLTSCIALLLGEIGWLTLRNLVFLLLGYLSALVLYLLHARAVALPTTRWHPSRHTLVLAGILALAAALFFHPHEYLFGGADAGVYVSQGANIATTGSLRIEDKELGELDPLLAPLLLREQPPSSTARYLRFPGFYIIDLERGLISPQFLPLHPLWIALFHRLFGLNGSLYATPCWGLLGVLSVYFATRRLFDARVAGLAAFLLTITAAQIWFARYPTSEALSQFLVFSAIYAFAAWVDGQRPQRLFALAAGLSLGAVLLTRIDAPLLLIPPLIFFLYLSLSRRLRAAHAWFFLPLLFMVSHSLLHWRAFSWPYVKDTYSQVLEGLGLTSTRLLWGLSLALMGYFLLLARADRISRLGDALWSRRRGILGALIIMVCLLALYGYFVRPALGHVESFYYWYVDAWIPNYDHQNLVRLGWYLSPLGIWLAAVGASAVLWRDLSPKNLYFLAIASLFSTLYLYRTLANPHHIYVMRRYVPVVIPSFLILAAYALLWARDSAPLGGWERYLSLALSVVLILLLLRVDWYIIGHVEYQGAASQLQVLANLLPEEAMVLVPQSQAVGVSDLVGTPLQYIFQREIFGFRGAKRDIPALEKLARDWQRKGKELFLIKGDDAPAPFSDEFVLIPREGLWIDVPALEHSYEHIPTQRLRFTLPLEIYLLLSTEEAESKPAYPFYLDIGLLDSNFLLGGFYHKERGLDTIDFRWTGQVAQIALPPLKASRAMGVTLRMASPRPEGTPSSNVSLYLNEVLLDEFELGPEFDTYRASVPAILLADFAGRNPVLRLETDTWNPRAAGLSEDSRDLGIMLDWVKVELQG